MGCRSCPSHFHNKLSSLSEVVQSLRNFKTLLLCVINQLITMALRQPSGIFAPMLVAPLPEQEVKVLLQQYF